MKSIKNFRNYVVALRTRCVIQNLCYSVGFYINLCTIHFYDLLAKHQNTTKNVVSGKKVVKSPHSTARAKVQQVSMKTLQFCSVALVNGESTFSTQNPRATDCHMTSRMARYDWLRSHLCRQSAKKHGQIRFMCLRKLSIIFKHG